MQTGLKSKQCCKSYRLSMNSNFLRSKRNSRSLNWKGKASHISRCWHVVYCKGCMCVCRCTAVCLLSTSDTKSMWVFGAVKPKGSVTQSWNSSLLQRRNSLPTSRMPRVQQVNPRNSQQYLFITWMSRRSMLIMFDLFWLCRTVTTDPLADERSQKAEAALCATDCAPDSVA